ncbi:MAG: AMIN domain-containing protein [Gallionella sp.]|nr:AMIN domain-containing protein [Gallionella sp.]
MALAACASSPNGRMQMAAPTSVSAVYSEMDMHLSLVTEANTGAPCAGAECELDRAFDQKILRLGTSLAQSAFATYPDLTRQFGKFEFIIAEKSNPGSVSSAAGTVVIFRGVQKLNLGDETLAFLIAREMGHVIGRHHEENSATSILFSVLASVLMPMSNLISGSSAAMAQTASTSSAASTAAASAASFIGSKITISSHKIEQLREADAIAMNLLERLGWNRNDIAGALVASTRIMGDDSWSKDLRASAEREMTLAQQMNTLKLAGVQNSITGLNVSNTGNGETVIKVGLAQPLANLPAGFTTDTPPRIVLDFPNTTNGLGKSVQDFPEENLHSTNIIQSAGRTRLAINLNRMLSYNTRIEGNSLLITLESKIADIAVIDDTPHFAETNPVVR